MLINIVITVIGIFFAITLESFFISLLNFSFLIIILLILSQKLNWKYWVLITVFLTILIDILLHQPIGVGMLISSICVAILNLLFLFVPQKNNLLSYIPHLFSIIIYYILFSTIPSFFEDSVWGVLSLRVILFIVIKSLVSVIIIYCVNILISNLRTDRELTL